MSTQVITFEAPPADIEKIDEIAKNMGVDRSEVLNEAMMAYLARFEDFKKSIEESEEDIREGRTFSHEEVVARFASHVDANAA